MSSATLESDWKEDTSCIGASDNKGLMEEIMEVISRGSPSEEERQTTPVEVAGGEELPKSDHEEQTSAEDESSQKQQEEEEGVEQAQEQEKEQSPEQQEEAPQQPQGDVEEPKENASQQEETPQAELQEEPSAQDPGSDKQSEEGSPNEASKDAAVETAAAREEGTEATTEEAGVASEEKPAHTQPPQDITSSYLISDEEVLAKGVPDSMVDNYKRYHLKHSFGIKSWYDQLKEHTFETQFIPLTSKQIEVLIAASHPFSDPPSLDDDQQLLLTELQEEIDSALNSFGSDGAFIKLDTCSARDSVLDSKEQQYLQDIEDAVFTEMELEKQFANAYLIWRSWRSSSFRRSKSTGGGTGGGDSRLRRSFRRIQSTFSRPRPATTSKSTAEEGRGKGDDPLAEVKPPVEGADKTEGDGEQRSEEGKGGKEKEMEPVTTAVVEVEPTTQNEDTEGPAKTETEEPAKAETEEPAKTETEEAAKAETEEPAKTETEEAAKTETEEPAKTETEEPAKTETEEPAKTETEEPKKSEEDGKKPRSLSKKSKVSEEHTKVKVKDETMKNKILRAFMRAVSNKYRVTTAKEALNMLLTSVKVKEELIQLQQFSEHDDKAMLCIRRWQEQLPRYPGMQFRCFIYKNQMTAISQYDDVAYIPNITRFKTTIQKKILAFFNQYVKRKMTTTENYLMDLFVAPNNIYIVKLMPFHVSSGACLFTWREHKEALTTVIGSFKFAIVPSPKPDCFNGLQSWWQTMLEKVVQQQQKNAVEDPNNKKCVIL